MYPSREFLIYDLLLYATPLYLSSKGKKDLLDNERNIYHNTISYHLRLHERTYSVKIEKLQHVFTQAKTIMKGENDMKHVTRKLFALLMSICMVATICASLAVSSSAATPKFKGYTIIGDSITAGMGIKKIREVCDLEGDVKLVITLGYGTDSLRAKKRKDLDALVSYKD
mgnify:CR=1 FL=1